MKTIELHNGKWDASICPLLGANVVKLICDREQVLRMPEQSVDAYQFGMPILIPANRTATGRFHFQGKTYQMPINEPRTPAQLHGMVHNQPFHAESATDHSAVLYYDSIPAVYPFPFHLTVQYTLKDDGLYVNHTLQNTGDSAMPYTFCLHTTFVSPNWFRVPLLDEQEHDSKHMPTGRYIPLPQDQVCYTEGTNPQEHNLSGYYRSAGQQACIGDYRYHVSPEFDHWVLYNAGGHAGILCVEPQCGAVNGLNMENGHRVLLPHEQVTFHTSIVK